MGLVKFIFGPFYKTLHVHNYHGPKLFSLS